MRTRGLLCAALLALSLAPAPARADTTPLSTLPEKPARYGQATGKVPASFTSSPNDRIYLEAEGSACLVYDPPRYWIDGDATIHDRQTSFGIGGGESFGVERLVTRGDTAELERVTAIATTSGLDPIARSRIPLHAVAKLDGLAVHAYRWGAQIFLVTRTSGLPMVRADGGVLFEGSDCGIAYTMLQVRNGSSQVAQLRGTVPSTGRRYLVDASVSQTGRDPEPLLSVTARLLER